MSFKNNVIEPFLHSIKINGKRNAFYIDGKYYTYLDLAQSISKIRKKISGIPEKQVALVANDDLDTYASIFALWMEGKCYVPLHPGQPIERCVNILNQVRIRYILDSGTDSRYEKENVIMTRKLRFNDYLLDCDRNDSDDQPAYILFTSGSTGTPKGVVLTRKNLAGFTEAFLDSGYFLNENDRCLQMFDLTFDLSVQSYLLPLLHGACVYTVPPDRIKYEAVFELLDTHKLTFALMVPSVIHYLRPYRDEIRVPSMRYSLFCGEALIADEVKDWEECVPNARIDNVYGPTENTIYCTRYTCERGKGLKEKNGVLSIGKAMKGTETVIIDENNGILPAGKRGELCLSGIQLTPGYWENPEKNEEAFFYIGKKRFYRTGDSCMADREGDIYYYGRTDFQVKIQGYRIELGEIEHHAREFLSGSNAVAVTYKDPSGNDLIALCIEKEEEDPAPLLQYLKSKIPSYMVPAAVFYEKRFPLNANGKIDRKALRNIAGGKE